MRWIAVLHPARAPAVEQSASNALSCLHDLHSQLPAVSAQQQAKLHLDTVFTYINQVHAQFNELLAEVEHLKLQLKPLQQGDTPTLPSVDISTSVPASASTTTAPQDVREEAKSVLSDMVNHAVGSIDLPEHQAASHAFARRVYAERLQQNSIDSRAPLLVSAISHRSQSRRMVAILQKSFETEANWVIGMSVPFSASS